MTAILISMLAGLICLAGILAAKQTKNWALKHRHYFVGFAAGSLISIAFLHLIPESFAMTPYAPFGLLVGFLTLYFVNGAVTSLLDLSEYETPLGERIEHGEHGEPGAHEVHDAPNGDGAHSPCHAAAPGLTTNQTTNQTVMANGEPHHITPMATMASWHRLTPAVGYTFLLAIGLHSLIDGMIYGINFTVSSRSGLLTAVGLGLHEFPEGLMTYLILTTCGIPPRASFIASLLAASVSTPFGTIVSLPILDLLTPMVLGLLMSFSCGVLLYIGCTHLLPELEQSNRPTQYLGMLTGMSIGLVLCLWGHH